MTTERDLYGFLGGTADSGARYKIEIVRTETGYASRSASSSGTSAWKAIVPMTEGDLPTVTAKAIAKFAAKTVPGRDRAYTRPMDGTAFPCPTPPAVTGSLASPALGTTGAPVRSRTNCAARSCAPPTSPRSPGSASAAFFPARMSEPGCRPMTTTNRNSLAAIPPNSYVTGKTTPSGRAEWAAAMCRRPKETSDDDRT